ncbi:MAG: c-type cytochrome [Bacteroidota bacterium]
MLLKIMISTKTIIFVLSVMVVAAFSACTYNKEDQLYGLDCDTTAVTYNKNIKEIMETSCFSCHGKDAVALGRGLRFDSYEEVRLLSDDILNSIIRESNPMPKNAPRLSSCKINQIRAWINQGKLQ